jgi:hypothetical protein
MHEDEYTRARFTRVNTGEISASAAAAPDGTSRRRLQAALCGPTEVSVHETPAVRGAARQDRVPSEYFPRLQAHPP